MQWHSCRLFIYCCEQAKSDVEFKLVLPPVELSVGFMLGFPIKAELDQCAAGSVMREAIQQKINNKHYKVVGASL